MSNFSLKKTLRADISTISLSSLKSVSVNSGEFLPDIKIVLDGTPQSSPITPVGMTHWVKNMDFVTMTGNFELKLPPGENVNSITVFCPTVPDHPPTVNDVFELSEGSVIVNDNGSDINNTSLMCGGFVVWGEIGPPPFDLINNIQIVIDNTVGDTITPDMVFNLSYMVTYRTSNPSPSP